MSKTVEFKKAASGKTALFGEPYWISTCGRYKVCQLDLCHRPWHVYLRIGNRPIGNWDAWHGLAANPMGYAGVDSKEAAIEFVQRHITGIPL